ncbi:Papain family cysteine protease domain containing protein [Entamoeba marina]
MGKDALQNTWTLWILLWSFQFLLFSVVVKVVDVQPIAKPKQWSIPLDALTPVKDQGSRGSCWAHSTIGFIESDYRSNGIRSGLLRNDEVVQFSEQAYMSLIVQYCSNHKDIPLCRFGGISKNQTNNWSTEGFYYLRNVSKTFILPISVCPYQQQNGPLETQCNPQTTTLETLVSENPLQMEIKDIVTLYTIDEAKQLMLRTLSPLTFGINTMYNTIAIPCNKYNSEYNSSVCKECRHKCGNGCCTIVMQSMYSGNGIIDIQLGSIRRGGHSLLVVGWNDEYPIERNGYSRKPIYTAQWNEIDTRRKSTTKKNNKINNTEYDNKKNKNRWNKGGLILKNSYGPNGHTLGYFLQNHSLLNEDTICPLSIHPKRWYPLDVGCIVNGSSFMDCSNNKVRKISNDKVFNGATILKCRALSIEEASALGFRECGEGLNYQYALSMEWFNITFKNGIAKVREMGDGVVVYLARWKSGDISHTIKEVKTNITSWNSISLLFEMDTVVTNSEHCGYFFEPYDTIEYLISEYNHDTFESYGFSYFGIKWDKSSYYLYNKNSIKFHDILNSTKRFISPHFDGPFGGPFH